MELSDLPNHKKAIRLSYFFALPKEQDNPFLQTALDYDWRDWPVFPLHTPTRRGCSCCLPMYASVGKHPRTEHGFKDASIDAGQIRRCWQRWPQANTGLGTGAIGQLVVVDIGRRNGGHLTLEELNAKHGSIPDTIKGLTGGCGQHLLFQHPGEAYRLAGDSLGAGVDLKGNGGSIVVPPSRH